MKQAQYGKEGYFPTPQLRSGLPSPPLPPISQVLTPLSLPLPSPCILGSSQLTCSSQCCPGRASREWEPACCCCALDWAQPGQEYQPSSGGDQASGFTFPAWSSRTVPVGTGEPGDMEWGVRSEGWCWGGRALRPRGRGDGGVQSRCRGQLAGSG